MTAGEMLQQTIGTPTAGERILNILEFVLAIVLRIGISLVVLTITIAIALWLMKFLIKF